MDGFDEAKMKQLQLLKEKMKIAKAQKTDDISKKVENSFSHDVRNVRSFESEDMKFNKPGKKIFDIFSTNKKILHPKANRNIFQQSKNATNLSFKTKNENGILANDTEVFDTPLTFEEVMRRKNEKKKLKVEKNPQSIFSDILNNKQDNISPEKGNKNNLVSAFNGTSYNTTNNSNLGECHRLEQNNFNIECSEKNSTYTGIIPTNNNSADNINNRIGGDLIKNPNVLSSGNMDTKLALETKEIKNSSSLNLNTFNNLFQENNPKNQSNPNNSNNINNNAVSQQRNILSESLPLNFESQNARMNILNNVNNNGKFSNININNMGKFNNTNNSINNSSSRLFDMNLGAQMKDFQQIQQPANNNASLFGGAHQLNEFNLNKSGNFNNSNSGFNNSMNKSGIFSNLRNTINNADCSESKNMTNANNIFNSKSNTGNMGNSYGSIIKPNITNNANITNNNENINNHNEGAKFINSNSKNNMFNNTSPSNTSSIFSKTSSLFNKTPSLESNIFGTTGNNAFKNVSNNTVPNNQFNNTINPSKYSGNIISNEKNIFTSSNINQTIFGANIIPPTSIITNNTVQKQNNIYDNSIGNNNNFTQKSLQNNIFNNDKNNVHNNAQNSVQNNIFSNKIVENKNIFSPNNNLNNSVGSKLNFSNVNSNAMPNNNEQVKIMKFKNTLSQVKNMKMNSENTAIQNSNNFPINSSEVVTKNENDFSNQPSTDQKISEQTNNTHLTKINLNDNNVSAISDQNKNSDNIVDLSSNNINDDKEGKNLRKTISTYFNNLIPSIFSNSSKFVQSTNNTKESNTNKPTETSVHPSEINSNDNSKSHNLNEKVINTESINNSVVENANSVNMIPQTCNENNVANNNFSNKFTLDNNIGNVNIENKKTDSVFSNPSNTNVPNNGKPLFINQNSSLFGINQDNNVFVNGENVFGANNIFSSNNNHGINVNKLSSLNNNNTQNRGNNKVLLSLSRDMKTNLYENNSINNDKGVSGMTSNTTNHDIFQKNKNNSFINLNSKDFENKEDFEKFDKIYKNINCIDKNINYINKYAPENIKNTNNYIDENSNAIKNYEALSAANKLLLEKMNNPDNTTESNKEMKGIIDQLNKNINKNGEETDKYEENKANNKLHENKINIRNTEKGNNLSNMTLGKTLFETQMKNNGIEKSGTLGFNINTNELTPIQKLKLINETSKEISTNDESDLNEMIPEHVQKIMKRREYFKTKNKLLKTETDQASVKKMKPFVPTKYSESFRNTFYTNENNKNNIFSLKNLNTMGILDTQNYTQNYTKNNNELISGNTQNNLDFKSIIYNNDYNTHTPITGNLRNGSNATNISNSNNCSKFPQMINNICTNENIANMENELNSQTDFVSNIYKSLDKENYIYGKRDRNNFNIDDKNCINKNNNSSENISNFVNNNLTPEHEYLNCETKKKKIKSRYRYRYR